MKKIIPLICILLSVFLLRTNAKQLPFNEWHQKYSQCDSVIIGYSSIKDPIAGYIAAVTDALNMYLCGNPEQNQKKINYDVIDVLIDSGGYFAAVKILEGNNYSVCIESMVRITHEPMSTLEIENHSQRLRLYGGSADSLGGESLIDINSRHDVVNDGIKLKGAVKIEVEFISTYY